VSLNWKEINLILEELNLNGAQIQSIVQSAYDVIVLRLRTRASPNKGETKQVLVSISSGACRINETFRAVPKSDKPLRFAQFLSSKIVNGWITEISQLGDNRIVRIVVKRAEADGEANYFRLYIRLWSNAANFIVTDENGTILDAMRRQPKRGEITGGSYKPENFSEPSLKREFSVRVLNGEGSFNKKIDEFYAAQGGTLSLEALREQARRNCEGSIGKIAAALEKLREKEVSFANAEQLKIRGDEILSSIGNDKNSVKMAQGFYEQYKKEKNALAEIQREITQGEQELKDITERLERLLAETNPLILAKLLRTGSTPGMQPRLSFQKKKNRAPGLHSNAAIGRLSWEEMQTKTMNFYAVLLKVTIFGCMQEIITAHMCLSGKEQVSQCRLTFCLTREILQFFIQRAETMPPVIYSTRRLNTCAAPKMVPKD